MNNNAIKLTEEQLRNIVSESLKTCLKENEIDNLPYTAEELYERLNDVVEPMREVAYFERDLSNAVNEFTPHLNNFINAVHKYLKEKQSK